MGVIGSDQCTIQELIRIAFYRLYTRKDLRHVSRKAILKVLFHAKQRLPNSNPIKDTLAYYWYKEGPYSSLIYENIDHLQASGIITPSNSKYKTYLFDRDRISIPLTQSDKHMDEAKSAITETVDGFTHINALVEDLYSEAPHKWYDTYNLKFKVHFNNFCDKAASRNSARYTRDDILHDLEDAVIDFPPFPDFSELRRIFMRFARMLNSFLHTSDCLEHKEMFPILKSISNSIWNAFAYGVRIEHHDAYYEKEVNKWIAMYKEEISNLDADIRHHQKKIERVSTYVVKLPPNVADMKRHPEKYEFEELNIDHIGD